MKWMCWFFMCKWIHHVNVSKDVGLWQCARCKTISRGRALYKKAEAEGRLRREEPILPRQHFNLTGKEQQNDEELARMDERGKCVDEIDRLQTEIECIRADEQGKCIKAAVSWLSDFIDFLDDEGYEEKARLLENAILNAGEKTND